MSDIAIIFSFMKSLDPRSVVREGEFRCCERWGLWDRITILEKKAKEGRFLSDDLKADIEEAVTALMQSYAGSYSDLRTYHQSHFLPNRCVEADVRESQRTPPALYKSVRLRLRPA